MTHLGLKCANCKKYKYKSWWEDYTFSYESYLVEKHYCEKDCEEGEELRNGSGLCPDFAGKSEGVKYTA